MITDCRDVEYTETHADHMADTHLYRSFVDDYLSECTPNEVLVLRMLLELLTGEWPTDYGYFPLDFRTFCSTLQEQYPYVIWPPIVKSAIRKAQVRRCIGTVREYKRGRGNAERTLSVQTCLILCGGEQFSREHEEREWDWAKDNLEHLYIAYLTLSEYTRKLLTEATR